MDTVSPLSPKDVTLVDTNVFIGIGNPGSSKYRRFRRVIQQAGVTLLIPSRVEDEIEQGGVKPALERAQDEGWVRIVSGPTVSHSQATTTQDIVRRAIASKSSDKDEHDVEKADPVFAGLAVEYILDEEQSDKVAVITADRLAQKSIKTAMKSLGYDGQVSTLTLWDLIDRDDDDITLI